MREIEEKTELRVELKKKYKRGLPGVSIWPYVSDWGEKRVKLSSGDKKKKYTGSVLGRLKKPLSDKYEEMCDFELPLIETALGISINPSSSRDVDVYGEMG